jgi:uncharacterized protein (TIGR02217 family)
MSNLIYPTLPGLTWPLMRTPVYSTGVQTSTSGREVRVSKWAYARYKYKLKYEFLRDGGGNTDLQQLAGFFGRLLGQYDTFLFKDADPSFSVANNQAFALGDGTTTTFRLARSYGAQFVEPVAVVDSGATVFANGIAASGVTVNANAGTVSFAAAPASGTVLSWSGQYYWRCRFDSDEMSMDQFMSQLWQGTVSFITCKV